MCVAQSRGRCCCRLLRRRRLCERENDVEGAARAIGRVVWIAMTERKETQADSWQVWYFEDMPLGVFPAPKPFTTYLPTGTLD